MHKMSEYTKANPDVPLPPLPPYVMPHRPGMPVAPGPPGAQFPLTQPQDNKARDRKISGTSSENERRGG